MKYLSLSLCYIIQIYLRPQSILNIYGEKEDSRIFLDSWKLKRCVCDLEILESI